VARSAPSIDSYGAGGFRLSGAWHAGSLLIVGDEPRSWSVTRLADVSRETLAPVFEAGRAEVEFLLLGTGETNGLPPKDMRQSLLAAGMGFEFMDTPSAARLYNVLTSEGRRLAAALIAV
jgi:uncharacterized protein